MLWLVIGWLLAAAGAAVVAAALFADRPRGRKRCPGCWYDMAGAGADVVAGVRCPECGTQVKHERFLRRTRRRWAWVGVGALLLLAAYPASQEPLLTTGRWREAVPTWVIAYLWPLDFERWDTTGYEPMIDELVDNRIDDPTKNVWAARAFVARLERHAGRRLRRDPSQWEDYTVWSIDCSNHWEVLGRDSLVTRERCFGPHFPGSFNYVDQVDASRQCVRSLVDMAQAIVETDQWRENGGGRMHSAFIGPVIVLVAPGDLGNSAFRVIEDYLAYSELAQSDEPQPPVEIEAELDCSTRVYDAQKVLAPGMIKWEDKSHLLGRLQLLLSLHIEPDNRRSSGGDVGCLWWNEGTGLLVIRHRREVHAQIEQFLKVLEGTRWWDREDEAGPAAIPAASPG